MATSTFGSSDELDLTLLGSALLQSSVRLGLKVSPLQVASFERYADLLMAANQSFNLTALRTREAVFSQLFLDSLTLGPALTEHFGGNAPASLVDIGSGAGIPGIPLKLLWPQMHLDIVESVGKKCRFIESALEQLELHDVHVWNDRAEVVAGQPTMRDSADVCVARAVAPLRVVIELCTPFVQAGGVIACPKGRRAPAEIVEADRAARKLGLGKPVVRHVSPDIGVGDDKSIVMYTKSGPTPRTFPRPVGIAALRPL